MPKTVAVVVGDLGGCKELLGAVKLLEERGVKCIWFCDSSGKAADVLNKNDIAFHYRLPEQNDWAGDFILVGTSASAVEAQIVWTNYGHKNNIKVCWMEDLYGTGERKAVASVSPDVMLVIDETAKKIAQRVRPEVPTMVVGKPIFADLAIKLQKKSEIRQKIHSDLKIPDGTPLLTYTSGGEIPARVVEHMRMLMFVLEPRKGFVFAPRFHPKLPVVLREELWKGAEEIFGSRLIDARNVDITELVMSSDMLFSDWGCTESYVGVLANVPVGLMMYPEDSRLNDCGYPNATPPLLLTNSADNISNYDACRYSAAFAFMPNIGDFNDRVLEICRRPYLPLLQRGAEINIADTVLSLISS